MMNGAIVNGLDIPTLPSLVTWEKVITKDVGLDWSLFNNRLFGSFDFYVRDTKIWYVRLFFPLSWERVAARKI